MRRFYLIFWIIFTISFYSFCDLITNYDRPITIAILAKDKAHCLPLYLFCIENQTWPASKTYLYIRTNNNNDNTAQILKEWISKVKDRYLEIYFDDCDVKKNIQRYRPHEWSYERFKVLSEIRNKSIAWAKAHNSHYFVADCDNFILPHTIESLFKTGLTLVSPLLHSKNAYSNFHAAIDEYGYYKESPFYYPLLNQEIKGLIQVPVIHCTYFIHYELLSQMNYRDNTCRHEYVIFSDIARKKKIPQYLDTREIYGYLTFADDYLSLINEPWFNDFCSKINYKKTCKLCAL